MAFAITRKPYLLNANFSSGDYHSSALQTYSATGLAGQWKLNTDISTSGDAVDSSGNGRDATFALTSYRPAYNSTSGPSEYISLTSATFSSGKKAVIGTGATWDAIIGNDTGGGSTQKMSMSAWVKAETPGHGRVVDFSNGDLYFGYSAGASIEFIARWGGIDASWIGDASTIAYSQWVHIAVTYDATSTENTPVFYINGEKTGVNTLAAPGGGTSYTGIGTVRGCIGNDYAESKHFPGSLADVAIWNTILTPQDIRAIYSVASYGSFSIHRDYNVVGTNANPPFTGSYAVGLQGINISRFDLFGISIAPKMGRNGMQTLLSSSKETINVSPSTRTFFNDSLRMPQPISATGSLAAVEVISDDNYRVQQIPQYLLSRQTFGLEQNIVAHEPFGEMNELDPVVYLSEPHNVAYPVIIEVPNAVDPFDYAGAIEPFVIRKIIAGNSTFLGSIDDPEPTGIRGAVMAGDIQLDKTSKSTLANNFYLTTKVTSSYFEEVGLDPEEEVFNYKIRTSGSITLTSNAIAGDRIHLTSSDGHEVMYLAAAAEDLASNKYAIGSNSTHSLQSLLRCINNAAGHAGRISVFLREAEPFMTTSYLLLENIAKPSTSGSLSNGINASVAPISGTFSDSSIWSLKGFGGPIDKVYTAEIPVGSTSTGLLLPFKDTTSIQEAYTNVSNPEIRNILISTSNKVDLDDGYPGQNFKSAPCGFEYQNSRGIDSIAFGGLLK
jgi:hypothetical protein